MTRQTDITGVVRSQIRRGAVITAQWLNQGVAIDNALIAAVRGPRQVREPPPPPDRTERGLEELEKQGEEGDAIAEAPAPAVSAIIWQEIARVTETVRVYQNGDTTSSNFLDNTRVKTVDLLSRNAAGDVAINRFLYNN